jgi:ABC-type uncharacterized transport system involved in gliding motility auxiliary subunit
MAIGTDLKFILAVLNSTIGRYQLNQTVSMMDNGGYLMQKIYIEQTMICSPTKHQQTQVIALVDKLLITQTDADNEHLEKQLDAMVFEMFGFNPKEQEYLKEKLAKPLDRG